MWFTKNKKDPNKKFKLSLFIIFIITLVSWLIWFNFILHFVNKGVKVTFDEAELSFLVTVNKSWETNTKIMSCINVTLSGICFVLEIAYLILIGRNVRKNIKVNSYELIIHTAAAVGILIAVIKSADMLIKNTWSIYIPEISSFEDFSKVKLYLDQFMTNMSIPAAFILFSVCSISMSGKKQITITNIMKDTNIMLIAFGIVVLMLYPYLVVGITPRNGERFLGIEISRIFNHFSGALAGQCISVFAGTMMVIMALRLIANLFLSKKQMTYSHIVIYVIIFVFVLLSFIVCHATGPVDMEKFLKDESYIPLMVMWTTQTASCLAGSIYASISLAKHK